MIEQETLGTIRAGQCGWWHVRVPHLQIGIVGKTPSYSCMGGGVYLGEIKDNWDTGTEGINLPAALADKAVMKTGVKWVEPD